MKTPQLMKTKANQIESEIQRCRDMGYETFQDYLDRTGKPATEQSQLDWIGEGKWLITSLDKTPIAREQTPETGKPRFS